MTSSPDDLGLTFRPVSTQQVRALGITQIVLGLAVLIIGVLEIVGRLDKYGGPTYHGVWCGIIVGQTCFLVILRCVV